MKKMTVMAMAVAMLMTGSISAYAGTCCGGGGCADQQALQHFKQETSGLTAELKAKETELSRLSLDGYWGVERGYDGPDRSRINQLEAERKELQEKIGAVAKKYDVRPCCLS